MIMARIGQTAPRTGHDHGKRSSWAWFWGITPGSERSRGSALCTISQATFPRIIRTHLVDMPVIVRHQDRGAPRFDHRHDQALCRRRAVFAPSRRRESIPPPAGVYSGRRQVLSEATMGLPRTCRSVLSARASEQGRKVIGPSGGGLDGIGAQLVWGLRVAPQPASDDPGNLVRGRMMPVAGPVQGGPLARG
jgi:hypothetical protein